MVIGEMMKPRLPSPSPSTNSGELLQDGFQQLIQHNSGSSFPRTKFDYDEGAQLLSTPNSSFASPAPAPAPAYPDDGYHYGSQQPSFTYSGPEDGGLGIQYDGYPASFMQESFQYAPISHEQRVYPDQYDSAAGTPPTLAISIPGSDVIHTRSGLTIQRALKPLPRANNRVSKSPKPKKGKKEKNKMEKKVAKLERPLSELTASWTHVPVVDIDAYVNRTTEERRKEVAEGKIPGKVKRPMNSFMLYRKAYQNRTKNWCLQNNHQVVSQVCGDSWPLEPEAVRDQYNEWARIERQNHQNAHPGYKFSPSKPNGKALKRKLSEGIESDESDLEEYDWEKGHSARSRKYQNRTPRLERNTPYSQTGSVHNLSRDSSIEPVMNSYNRSTYQSNNPGRQAPDQYDRTNLRDGQYYQQTVHQNTSMPHNSMSHIPNVEDVVIKRTIAPGMNYATIPTGNEFDSMNQYQFHEESGPQEQRIDPSLMGPEVSLYDENFAEYDTGTYSDGGLYWQGPFRQQELFNEHQVYLGGGLQYEEPQFHSAHLNILGQNNEAWQVDTLDAGKEFEKWMNES